MFTSQRTSSRLEEGSQTSGGGPRLPSPREEDGSPPGSPQKLRFYCALAAIPLFAVAVLTGATGLGLPAGIVAGVLFVLAVVFNMPGLDLEPSPDRTADGAGDPRAPSAAGVRDGEVKLFVEHDARRS